MASRPCDKSAVSPGRVVRLSRRSASALHIERNPNLNAQVPLRSSSREWSPRCFRGHRAREQEARRERTRASWRRGRPV